MNLISIFLRFKTLNKYIFSSNYHYNLTKYALYYFLNINRFIQYISISQTMDRDPLVGSMFSELQNIY